MFLLSMLKIATKYIVPELAGASLTPKVCRLVADAFVSKYGKYAGWAQTLLFIAELPAQKAILPSSTEASNQAKIQTEAEAVQETKGNCKPQKKKGCR